MRDLPEKDHKASIPRRVKEALHANVHMQNAMQKVQLLFAAIGHADGHSSNLHIQYLDENGREVTHDEIIDLVRQGKDDVVSSLRVNVQVFDLDSAFPNIRTLKPQYAADRSTRHRAVFMDGKEQDHVPMPRRTHNMGPAPFHTNNDLKRLIGLKAELDSGVLGMALQWYLLRDETGATDELGALEARVSENIDLIQQQFEEGRLLDEDTGQVLRRGAQRSESSVGLEPSGPPNQQRRLNDTAPTMISPIAGRVNAKKNREEKLYGTVPQSLIHKYFRLA